MVMTLSLLWLEGFLTLVAAYENGLAMVARLGHNQSWEVTYRSQSHSQPILSLDVPPDKAYFLTSGADAIIVKHPIPNAGSPPDSKTYKPESKSQEKPTATTTSPPAASAQASSSSLLSSALSSGPPNPPQPSHQKAAGATSLSLETTPLKTVNTKHSGQQALRIRSDGKIFATAGWDSKVRVYSTKTLSELAVLKWHDVGCYAIAFAAVGSGSGGGDGGSFSATTGGSEGDKEEPSALQGGAAVSRVGDELSMKDRRIRQAKEAHWLAAGSKDGKISLWDIY